MGHVHARAGSRLDPYADIADRLLHDAAAEGAVLAHAGGTAAATLVEAILAEAAERVVAGVQVIDLMRGLERGLCVAIGALHALAHPADAGATGLEVVPGDGRAYLGASDAVASEADRTDAGERAGLTVLARALRAPARRVDPASAPALDRRAFEALDASRQALECAVSVATDALLGEATRAALLVA